MKISVLNFQTYKHLYNKPCYDNILCLQLGQVLLLISQCSNCGFEKICLHSQIMNTF